jgi:hypothetical protein
VNSYTSLQEPAKQEKLWLSEYASGQILKEFWHSNTHPIDINLNKIV